MLCKVLTTKIVFLYGFMKAKVIRLGGLFDKGKSTHQAGSIYDPQGLAPNLDTCGGGYRQPLIIVYEKEKEK